jgi:hypothetical protein
LTKFATCGIIGTVEKENEMNLTKISRSLLKSMNFRPFNDSDYNGFAGVESPVPLIAENDDEGICIVIDGDRAELYCFDGCANFELVDTCDNIRELPIKSDVELQIEKLEAELAKLKSMV